MKKKLLTVLAMTSLLAIAGCGETNAGGGSNTVTIKYTNQWGDDKQSQITALIEDFEKANPGIKVEEIKGGGYDGVHTQTMSDINTANGEHGDLVICYPDHVMDYINAGYAVDLQELIDDPEIGWSEREKQDYIEGFVNEGKQFPIEGTYCLPYVKSTEALYYNQDILVGLNLSAQDPTINGGASLTVNYLENLTWEEFFEHLCPALTAFDDAQDSSHKIIIRDSNTKLYGICGYDSTANLFINLCEQYGYGYTSVDTQSGRGQIDFNNEHMWQLCSTFQKAARAGYLRPASAVQGGLYCSDYFKKQNILFNIGSTAGAAKESSSLFEAGVAPIPGAAEGNRHVISQGPSFCILAHYEDGAEMAQKRINAAWKFYNWLTSTQNNAEWAIEQNYLPVRTTSLETDEYIAASAVKGKTGVQLTSAKACQYSTAASNNVFASPVFKGSSEARTQVGALMSNILNADHELTIQEIQTMFDEVYDNILKAMGLTPAK